MTEAPALSPAALKPVDRPVAIAAYVTLSVVGAVVFNGMPVIVGALADGYGFSESEAGYLTTMDLAGGVLASLLVSFLVTRVNRRQLVLVGFLLAVLLNGVAAFVQDYSTLMAIRLIAGLGSGVVYAMSIALLAGTHHLSRNFSILLFAQVSASALELFFFPKLAASFGTGSIFAITALASALSMSLLPFIPVDRGSTERGENIAEAVDTGVPLAPWWCLLAIFFFYLCVGSFWAYCERLGVGAGLDGDSVSVSLALGNLFSLIGCGLAYWLSQRFGQARPLLIALAFVGAACVLLSGEVTPFIYVLGTYTYFLFWNLIDIYQLGSLSELDHSGRFAALVPAFQGVGLTLGPAGSAWLLDNGLNLSEIVLLDAATTAVAFICFLMAFSQVRRGESK